VPDLPIKFVGGHPAIDFVNTADWPGPVAERLTGYGRLVEWSEDAGLLSPEIAARLRSLARRNPRNAAAALQRTHDTRTLLQRLFSRRVAGRIEKKDLAVLNRHLSAIAPRRQLTSAAATSAQWSWDDAASNLESPLWPVVWAAAELLASDEADQIRICPGDQCGWMFIDRSRNGLRRWCEMQTCGTAEKSKRRAAK
jgi:predicted RNA-binding Zn ribbon-like protein